ncbi:hypothetical protein FHG64_16425 [Antarcticibacterium flavum]|uniref:YARHG domain-containing protein n=1 Tax=Antarcticibacterium flavum TaxID=2058175 RepID=A0A5B7X884_9FLAO|nr:MULTISPECIES: hypothetical protein [Antarcticibacterium]MCM4159603.1 hypothetical protein [Antarcticibacterium sp. W02-3]QCY70851.1 hypothetical protein FHG64_16425 [Antarcticibacterium flavum]
MKKLIVVLFFLSFPALYAQEKSENIESTYISLEAYRNMGRELIKEDYQNLKIIHRDTMVQVPADFILPDTPNSRRLFYEFRDLHFLEKYKDVVYWKEGLTLKLWEDEIKMFLAPSIPKKHQEALLDFAEGLSAAIDSLKITEVKTIDEANFFLYYINSKDTIHFEPKLKGKKSSYYVYWNEKQKLDKGFVQVDSDLIPKPIYQLANLKYQFFRSLGMFGSSSLFDCKSYFSNCSDIRSLSSDDIEILKYHYSYNKANGVNKEGFEKFHSEMQDIHKKDSSPKIYINSSPL